MVFLGLPFWYVFQVERVILCVFLKKDLEVYEELLQVYFPLAAPEGDNSKGGELRMSLYCWCGDACAVDVVMFVLLMWWCLCCWCGDVFAVDVVTFVLLMWCCLWCWCGDVCAVDVVMFVLLMWYCLCCWCSDVTVCHANTALGKLPPLCARFCFNYHSTTVPKRLEWTT